MIRFKQIDDKPAGEAAKPVRPAGDAAKKDAVKESPPANLPEAESEAAAPAAPARRKRKFGSA